MIKLTERAAEGLQAILSASKAPPDRGVKLMPTESGGVEMVIAVPGEEDDVVPGDGGPLLIVDASIAPRLGRAVVDLASDEPERAAPEFVLRQQDDP